MITKIVSNTPYIHVGHYGGQPYIDQSRPSAGMVRYLNNQMEVYDGSSWLNITGGADVQLSHTASAAIEWADRKRLEEIKLKELMERHPGLKAAYEQFELMRILVTEEENQTK